MSDVIDRTKVYFRADLHGCMNHKCSAIVIADGGELHEVVSWSDGYSIYAECPERIWMQIEDVVAGEYETVRDERVAEGALADFQEREEAAIRKEFDGA